MKDTYPQPWPPAHYHHYPRWNLVTRVLMTDSSSESSRTSSDHSSEDKSASGPQVAKLRIKDGITTKEEPSFTGLRKGNEGIASKYDKRSSKRGTLNLGYAYRSNFLLRSRDLSRNRSRLTTNHSLDLGTLLSKNKLR